LVEIHELVETHVDTLHQPLCIHSLASLLGRFEFGALQLPQHGFEGAVLLSHFVLKG
jgi:hypothetical protein